MKKTITTVLCLMLVLVLGMTLFACGNKEEAKNEIPKKDPVSLYKADGFEKSTLKNQVSWEGINSFKSTAEIAELYKTDSAAAIAEARKTTVDFFTYAKTATWIPGDTWEFTHHADGTGPDVMNVGQVYGGLPYVGLAYSAIYRLMDFIDPETGVVNIKEAGRYQAMFGNQCAQGSYQGWSRFINSAKYGGTPSMTVANNFIRVGDYVYPDVTPNWTKSYNTVKVCEENGKQAIFESYAKVVPADGVVNYTTAGHVMMIVSEPTVVRNEDGTINGVQSYVYITDQHVRFENYTHPNGGDQCQAARYVNKKCSFDSLFEDGYIPFIYKEWLGEDPIEVPEYKYSHSGDSITLSKIFETRISSNYHLYDAYFSVYDAVGNEVLKVATHNKSASTYEIKFMKAGEVSYIWGSLEDLEKGGEYTVKVYAQSGTGARPDLWEGKLIVD